MNVTYRCGEHFPSFIDYRDWVDATPEQRKAWNCALDLVFSRLAPQNAPLPTYHY